MDESGLFVYDSEASDEQKHRMNGEGKKRRKDKKHGMNRKNRESRKNKKNRMSDKKVK